MLKSQATSCKLLPKYAELFIYLDKGRLHSQFTVEDKEAKKVTTCVSRGCSLRDRRRNSLPRDSEDNQQRARKPQTLIQILDQTVTCEVGNLVCNHVIPTYSFVWGTQLEPILLLYHSNIKLFLPGIRHLRLCCWKPMANTFLLHIYVDASEYPNLFCRILLLVAIERKLSLAQTPDRISRDDT